MIFSLDFLKNNLLYTYFIHEKLVLTGSAADQTNQEIFMTKEVVRHRKDERKKPQLTLKERRAKKQEKKQNKSGKV